ncbi:hypothetical protein ACU686_35225 [Yinghuangia aomiensis]
MTSSPYETEHDVAVLAFGDAGENVAAPAPDSGVVIAEFSGEPGPLSHSHERLRVFESVTEECAKSAADGEGAVSARV